MNEENLHALDKLTTPQPSWVRKDQYDGVNSTELQKAVQAATTIEEKGEIILDAIEYCITHKDKKGRQRDIWNALLGTFNNITESGFAGFTNAQYQRFKDLCSQMNESNKNRMDKEKEKALNSKSAIMWNALNAVNDNITADEANQKQENGETIQTPVICKNGEYTNRQRYNWSTGKPVLVTSPYMEGSKYENNFVTVKMINGEKIYSASVSRYGELNLNERQIQILSEYLSVPWAKSPDYFMQLCKKHPELVEELGIVTGEEARKLANYDESGKPEYAFKNEQGEVSIFLSGASCSCNFRSAYDAFMSILNAKSWLENLSSTN